MKIHLKRFRNDIIVEGNMVSAVAATIQPRSNQLCHSLGQENQRKKILTTP